MMASLQVQGDLSKQSVAFSTKYHAFRKKKITPMIRSSYSALEALFVPDIDNTY